MRRGCALLLLAAIGAAAPRLAHADEDAFIRYTTQPGDTCPKIAARLYNDPKRIDLIHANNDLGRPPHRFSGGQVLLLPRPGAPDAHLTFVRHEVEAYTPLRHPGQRDEPLIRGNRVSTLLDSSAEVTFVDQSRLQLGEHTLVVILGNSNQQARREATADDTTLLRGSLRAHLGELVGRPAQLSLATSGGHAVRLEPGEARVEVDEKRRTRLAVYRGKGRLRGSGKEVAVPAGFGSSADPGRPPTPARPLPPAPVWATPLPRLLLGTGGMVAVSASYAPGPGPSAPPAGFHVQIARDEGFNDLLVDTRVPGDVMRLQAQLGEAEYLARISAVDAEGFEGPESPVWRVRVATARLVPGQSDQRARFEVTPGLRCGLDGAALQPVKGPIELSPIRGHALRCAAGADDEGLAERSVAVADSGPLVVEQHIFAAKRDARGVGTRELRLRVTDATGAPVSGAPLQVTTSAGVTVSPPKPQRGPDGSYSLRLRWEPGIREVGLRCVLEGQPVYAGTFLEDPAGAP